MTLGLALRVPCERAESVRVRLRTEGLVDAHRRTVVEGNWVVFPLRARPNGHGHGELVMAELPERFPAGTSIAAIRESTNIPAVLRTEIPGRWKRLGDIVVVRIPSALWDYRSELGRAFGEVLHAHAVLAEVGGVRGPWREPHVVRIWGRSSETVHTENGVRFKFDPDRIMFSSGNLRERIRMGALPRPGETVVDLFAGIGYFAIPMAVHSRAKRIVACEINPVAFEYLRENCRLNRAASVEPRLGDCRAIAPRGVADRVVMGYLEAAMFLPVGLAALRAHGGWVHYHEAAPDATPDAPRDRLEAAARAAGFRVMEAASRRLKSLGPRVGHWVVDARVAR